MSGRMIVLGSGSPAAKRQRTTPPASPEHPEYGSRVFTVESIDINSEAANIRLLPTVPVPGAACSALSASRSPSVCDVEVVAVARAHPAPQSWDPRFPELQEHCSESMALRHSIAQFCGRADIVRASRANKKSNSIQRVFKTNPVYGICDPMLW